MNSSNRRGGLAPDKYLSEEQERKILLYVKDKADLARQRGSTRAVIDELVVMLLLRAGLRASELCDLTIGDLPHVHGKDCIWVRDGKGSVMRTVDIGPKLIEQIKRFCKLYRKGAEPEDPLFISERGNRFGYMSLYSKIRGIGKKAGVKLHPHMLRHTYATKLYGIERDLRFVQDQLGHASPETTSIYARTSPEARVRQVQEVRG